MQNLPLGMHILAERGGRLRRLAPASPLSYSNGGKRATGPGRRDAGTPGDRKENDDVADTVARRTVALARTCLADSRRWGYSPSGTLGAVLLAVISLALLGRFNL
jgi:hypothetical protein